MRNAAVNIEIEGSEWHLEMKLEEIRQFFRCFGSNSDINYISHFQCSTLYCKKAICKCVV